MNIIGLAGKAGCGKDTVADFMEGYISMSPADNMKAGLCAMLSISSEELEKKKREPDSKIRYMLQTLGTEWGRNLIGNNFWLHLLEDRMNYLGTERKYVIPSVRFLNEAAWVKSLGGTVIHIDRPSLSGPDLHVSECDISEACDYTIMNDGSLEDLKEQTRVLLDLI